MEGFTWDETARTLTIDGAKSPYAMAVIMGAAAMLNALPPAKRTPEAAKMLDNVMGVVAANETMALAAHTVIDSVEGGR